MALEFKCADCGSEAFEERASGNHIGLYCHNCGKWAKWILQPIENFIIGFGKHKGEKILDAASDDPEYFEWLLKQDIKNNLRKRIYEALERCCHG